MSAPSALRAAIALCAFACSPAAVEPKAPAPDRCSESAAPRAEPAPAPSNTATAVAAPAPAPLSVEGNWHWTCCNGLYTGGLVLTQEGRLVRGIFLGDRGMGTYVDGEIDGTKLVFTRRWLNSGRPFSQIYSIELAGDVATMSGTFIETHAPGPPQPFNAERRWQPDLYDFAPPGASKPVEPKRAGSKETKANKEAAENPLLPRCDCKNACVCSGLPDRMRCHSECGCPRCPPNIP